MLHVFYRGGTMIKRNLTLTVNGDLLKQARHHDINISSFLTIKLQEYIALIKGKNNKVFPNTMDEHWARGLVGYDVALTWRRSPVQIWPGPLFFLKITSFFTNFEIKNRLNQ